MNIISACRRISIRCENNNESVSLAAIFIGIIGYGECYEEIEWMTLSPNATAMSVTFVTWWLHDYATRHYYCYSIFVKMPVTVV